MIKVPQELFDEMLKAIGICEIDKDLTLELMRDKACDKCMNNVICKKIADADIV